MKNKIKFITLSLFIILIISLILYIGNKSLDPKKDTAIENKIKSYIPANVAKFLKEKIFVHAYLNRTLKDLEKTKSQLQIAKEKISLNNSQIADFGRKIATTQGIGFNKILNKKLIVDGDGNKYYLSKFKNEILSNQGPRAYLKYYDNKLILASGTGIFTYINFENFNKNSFIANVIPSNLQELIDNKEFYRNGGYGIKGLLIHQDKIYISFSNQMKKDCFNTAIIVADFNLVNLKFEKFFFPKNCINKINSHGGFKIIHSGGIMFPFTNQRILFTVGEYKFRVHAQTEENIFGKIIAINKNTKDYQIIQMGHRNPQGLYYDSNNDVLISTDHGPQGGDEININLSPNKKMKNYGWPISSYGEHYGFTKREDNHPLYIKAPLYKSHEKYGFVEPIKYFTPSIAISQIIKVPFKFNGVDTNQYFVGALGHNIKEGDLSIHHIELNNDNNEILKYNVLPLGERIRDMIYVNKLNKVFLFLENTSSVGVLETEN